MNSFIQKTSMGDLKGLSMENNTIQYRGIRYATAERWKYPIAVDEWEGVYDATYYKAACPQLRTFAPEKDKTPVPFYYKEFREGIDFDYNEDCLFLDIYAPKDCKNVPVIIYIHGGAFLGGCSHEKHMDGTAYAKENIIFVSINYRLGALGFIADRKLVEESGHSGNYGLYDQLEAIKWVHNHIKEFGGDPDNITLFGQSAGAMSVQMHCFSPITKPFIKQVYMASGAGIGEEFAKVNPVEDSYDYWAKMTSQLGNTPDDWRNQPIEKVFEAFNCSIDQDLMLHCCPHVDGLLIPKEIEQAAADLDFAHVPYILSTNSDDIAPDWIHKMSKSFCQLVNENSGSAYYFYFKHKLPGDDDAKAFHSAELWYTLGSLNKCWRPMGNEDCAISSKLISVISSFAKTGNPNSKKVFDWVPYQSDIDTLVIE